MREASVWNSFGSMKTCRVGRGVALLSLVCSLASSVGAARVDIPVQVDVGFGAPLTESGKLYPVTITMDNKVASTRGMIELLQPNPSGKQEVRYQMPFVLPSPSVKQFRVYVPLSRSRELSVSIRFKDYIKSVRSRPQIQWDEKRSILSLGVSPLQRRWRPNEHYAVFPVSRDLLPAEAVGYDSLRAMIMTGRALEGLDPERLAAIRSWLRAGGRMLLSDVSSGPVFRMRAKQLCGESAAETLLQRGDHRVGAGWVISSGVLEEGDKPFWIEDTKAVQSHFPPVDQQDLYMYGNSGGFFFQLFSGSRSMGAAGFLWLIVIIVAYVAVIGPIDWSLTRKLKKPHLTWWFFAAAIGLFSLVAYGYSRVVNTGTTQALYLNVVDTSPEMQVFKGASRMGVYSAANKRYQISPRIPGVVMGAQETMMGVGSAAGVTVQLAPESSMIARIPIFSSKQFHASWYRAGAGRVTRSDTESTAHFSVEGVEGVRTAFLARREGLLALSVAASNVAENAGVQLSAEMSRLISWNEALEARAAKMHMPHHYGRHSRANRKELPTPEEMRRYLVCMGFVRNPQDANSGGGNVNWQVQTLYNSRDAFERGVSLVDQLEDNDVLMLMVPGDADFTPVDVEGAEPNTSHYTCIRVLCPRP